MADSTAPDDLSREELIALVLELRAIVAAQAKRIAKLEKQLGMDDDPPASAKPSSERRPAKPKDPVNKRKKRNLNFCRRRETPTKTINHKPESCPDCGRHLSGGTPAARRQVIDIPPVSVSVVEHVRWDRWCGACGKRVRAQAELAGLACGKRRFGPNLTALVAHLHISARAPIRVIQSLMRDLFNLRVSVGGITDMLKEVADRGASEVAAIAQAVKSADYVHSDETGWRENGEYRCLWTLATPTERFHHIDERRTAEVAKSLIGDKSDRTLVTDFFASYNQIPGRHQRCWAHFKRALDALALSHPNNPQVQAWIQTVFEVWRDARAYRDFCLGKPKFGAGVFDRKRKRQEYQQRLYAIAEPFLEADPAVAPQATLSRRIGIFLNELFTFVEYPEVPDDNNAAERAIRQPVIMRKVCGGTRSARATKVKASLMTLFGTFSARGQNPLLQCKAILTTHPP
jgi:transposase